MTLQITHGRHCRCSACAREDWTNPALASCGMHGEDCPAAYQPLGNAGGEITLAEATAALPYVREQIEHHRRCVRSHTDVIPRTQAGPSLDALIDVQQLHIARIGQLVARETELLDVICGRP